MHRLRTFLGLLALSTTLISIFYITSRGNQKTQSTKDSLLVQNLKQNNHAYLQKIEELETELLKFKSEQEKTNTKLSESVEYINSLTARILAQKEKECIDSSLQKSTFDFSEAEISKYKTAFINKNAEVKKFMSEKIEATNKGRFVELGGIVSPNVILLYSTEVIATKTYPTCEVSKTTFGTYEYDYKKNTFKKI